MAHPTQQKSPSASTILHEASGFHLLLTLKDCDPALLNDLPKLQELTRAAAEATGATVLEICTKQFSPVGVTSMAVLAESHASLHTYPEANVVFWDIFTCGTICKPELSIDVLTSALKPGTITKRLIKRN
ncbi:MAG: adenosylmethionine decarboxylase [Candidatus Obscuribacterales bacterium]|nr:adenosylmethionine decarboxylase [Candidatus Obscuribacterales bacterium]